MYSMYIVQHVKHDGKYSSAKILKMDLTKDGH